MIGQVTLRLFQCAVFGGLTAVGAMAPTPAEPQPLWFTVSVVGQNEREDGSWAGVDVLRSAAIGVERFQLTLSSPSDATAEVWSVGRSGEVRLHEAAVKLRKGRAYAFPSPTAFYELEGDAPLRIRVCLRGAEGRRDAAFQSVVGTPLYPLSDGTPFQVEEHLYSAEDCGEIRLRLKGR